MIFLLIKAGSRYPFDRKEIRQRIKNFLLRAGLEDVELSLLVMGTRKGRLLNFKYRRKDEAALVLSFPLEESRSPDGILRLGDVVVCYPLVRQKAVQEKRMVDEVMWEVVEHGIRQILNPKCLELEF